MTYNSVRVRRKLRDKITLQPRGRGSAQRAALHDLGFVIRLCRLRALADLSVHRAISASFPASAESRLSPASASNGTACASFIEADSNNSTRLMEFSLASEAVEVLSWKGASRWRKWGRGDLNPWAPSRPHGGDIWPRLGGYLRD
jgi:hypothetical protein